VFVRVLVYVFVACIFSFVAKMFFGVAKFRSKVQNSSHPPFPIPQALGNKLTHKLSKQNKQQTISLRKVFFSPPLSFTKPILKKKVKKKRGVKRGKGAFWLSKPKLSFREASLFCPEKKIFKDGIILIKI